MSKQYLSDVHFFDENNGWVTTGKDSIYRTTNGKDFTKTYVGKPDSTRAEGNKIIFVTPTRGFMTRMSKVLETTDGGIPWFRSLACKHSYIRDIYSTKPDVVWTIDDRAIYKLQL